MGIKYFKDHIKFIGDCQNALLKLLSMFAPLVGFGRTDIVKFDPVNEENYYKNIMIVLNMDYLSATISQAAIPLGECYRDDLVIY